MGPRVLEMINHRNQHFEQYIYVVDRMPLFKYEKKGEDLIAKDGAFHHMYEYEKPRGRFKAFAGREFDIPMLDGSSTTATGQYWDRPPQGTISVGINTLQGLAKCPVFIGCTYMEIKAHAKMFDNLYPYRSNNIRKHDIISKFAHVHIIDSPFKLTWPRHFA